MIKKKDWNSRVTAKSEHNQKKILRMFAMSNIAHTSMEKVPTSFAYLIWLYWDRYPITGAIATPKFEQIDTYIESPVDD